MHGVFLNFALAFAAYAIANTHGQVSNFNYQDCGSTAQILVTEIQPCPPFGNGGCYLAMGGANNVHLVFQTNQDYSQVEHDVKGRVFGIMELPMPGMGPPNACERLSPGCPVRANQATTYDFSIPISPSFPPISTRIVYKIWGVNAIGEKVLLVCFRLEAKLERANSPSLRNG